jgi:hypothetical protein
MEIPSSPYFPDSGSDAGRTGFAGTDETNVVPFTAGIPYSDNTPMGSTHNGHPYVYASAGNAFGSTPDQGQDQRQEMAMMTPAFTPAQSALAPAPMTYSSSAYSQPDNYPDWASFRPPVPPSAVSHSTEQELSSHPFGSGLSVVNTNTNRLSALSGISGRESVAGLAYLASEEPEAGDGHGSAVGPSWSKIPPGTMTVMNADDAENSASSRRFNEKSGYIPSDLRTRRQDDESVPPPPAYSYTSAG